MRFTVATIEGRVGRAHVALSERIAAIEPILDVYLHNEAGDDRRAAVRTKIELQSGMTRLSREVTQIFEPWWRVNREAQLNAKQVKDQSDLDDFLIKTAHLFVAGRVVDFLRQVFPQMKNLVVFASIGLLALMLAASSYPFPQRDTIGWLSWLVLLSVIGVTFAVFIQINRDRVVSMLMGTTPGQLN
jgi:hypothetical protein